MRYLSNSLAALRILSCVLTGVVAIGVTSSRAGEPDGLVQLLSSKRATECQDFIYNAKEIIPRLYSERKIDSVREIMKFVEQRCGECALDPLPQLLDMIDDGLPENWCDTAFIENLLGYHRAWHFDIEFGPSSFLRSQCAVPGASMFDDLIIRLADTIEARYKPNSNEYLVAEYYRGRKEEILLQLRRGGYGGTCAQGRYRARIDQLRHMERVRSANWSFGAGVWIPTGKANLLGMKPELSGQLGIRSNGWGVDLTVLLRFLNAKNPYWVMHDGAPKKTSYFFGGYIGFDPSLRIISTERYNLEIFGGIGYDGFAAITSDDGDESESINALGLSLGMTQRFFKGRSRLKYIGVQARYTFVKYSTHGGTDLSGNTISVNLLLGGMGNEEAKDGLKLLRYYD